MNNAFAYGHFEMSGLVRTLVRWTRGLPHSGFGRSWVGKRLGFLLRRMAVLSLGGAPVDVISFGANFRLFPYNNLCEKRILFSPTDFDAEERAVLASRIKPDFTFLDIGANIGGYSLAVAAIAASKGFSARILAIEPQPDVFDRLIYNISINPFGTIKALAIAIADREGEITLFLDQRNKGEASIKIVSADRARQMKVIARPLFALLKDEGFSCLDALKIDVEGAEDIILQQFFGEAPPSLWPKLIVIAQGESRWGFDLLAFLIEKGYAETLKTSNNHILELCE